jgi:hypothetical protein
VISSLPSRLISQTQPLPKRPMPAALNFVLNSSKEPNVLLIASAKLPEGEPPSFDKISQKKVWFQCPPPLLRTAGEIFPHWQQVLPAIYFHVLNLQWLYSDYQRKPGGVCRDVFSLFAHQYAALMHRMHTAAEVV